MKPCRVAECIHGGVNLGAQPTLAASAGLVAAPFLRAPALLSPISSSNAPPEFLDRFLDAAS
jgi:hypothetical protein